MKSYWKKSTLVLVETSPKEKKSLPKSSLNFDQDWLILVETGSKMTNLAWNCMHLIINYIELFQKLIEELRGWWGILRAKATGILAGGYIFMRTTVF